MATTVLPPVSSIGLSSDARLFFAMFNMKDTLIMLGNSLDMASDNTEKAELFLKRADVYRKIVCTHTHNYFN